MTTLRIEERRPRRRIVDGTSLVTVLLCFSLLVPSRYVYPPLGGVGRPDVLIGLVLLGMWLVTFLVPRMTYRQRNPLRYLIVFWLFALAGSLVAAYARGLSPLELSGTQRSAIGILSNIGLLLVVSEGIRSRERLETLLKRLTYLGGAVAMVGSLQFFAGVDPTRYMVPPGLGLNRDLYGIGVRSIFNRVAGTSIHAIEYGAVLALILPLAIHFALHAKSRGEAQWRWALAGLIAVSGLYSVSRTNTIALGVVLLLLVALWTARARFNALIVAMVGAVAVRAAIPGLLGTIRSLFDNLENDPSIQGRTQDYPLAFEYVAQRPIWGRGVGTFNIEEYFVLDNNWLGTLIQMGWVGVAANALLLVVPFAMARHLLNVGRDDEWRHLAGVLASLLAVVFLVSFFFDSGGFPQFRSVQMLVIGAVGAMWGIERRKDPHDFRPGVRRDLLKATKSRHGSRHPEVEPPTIVVEAIGPGTAQGDGRP